MFDTLTDSRILGMGDVLTLIEKAEEAASEKDQAAMEARTPSSSASTTS